MSLPLRMLTQSYEEGQAGEGETSQGDDWLGAADAETIAVGAEITRACRMCAKLRVHPGNSPGHW
jgi:hypothetical protein